MTIIQLFSEWSPCLSCQSPEELVLKRWKAWKLPWSVFTGQRQNSWLWTNSPKWCCVGIYACTVDDHCVSWRKPRDFWSCCFRAPCRSAKCSLERRELWTSWRRKGQETGQGVWQCVLSHCINRKMFLRLTNGEQWRMRDCIPEGFVTLEVFSCGFVAFAGTVWGSEYYAYLFLQWENMGWLSEVIR